MSPREVELALEGLPGVQHALVMGLPHPTLEEEVGAVVVPAPGVILDTAELDGLAREQLSSYKVPTRWVVLTDEGEIPWLASGKPDKRALRRRLLDS